MQDDLLRASLTDAQEISQARVRKEARGSDCRDPPEDFSGTRRVELRSLMSLPGTQRRCRRCADISAVGGKAAMLPVHAHG